MKTTAKLLRPTWTTFTLTLSMIIGLGLIGCKSEAQKQADSAAQTDAAQKAGAAAQPEEINPLPVGASAGTGTLTKPDGTTVNLASLYKAKPTVLVFYRGGWCPYCNTQLGNLAKVEPKLTEMGFQILAISPDSPTELSKANDKAGYTYQLLSDSDMSVAKAFGLAFRVDDETVKKYKLYGIDLEKASGEKHQLLPVPAVYIVDTRGVVRFAHSDPDYKKRLDTKELLKAAQNVK